MFVNEIWATDITYIATAGGMLYYTAVIDLYGRKILSWKLSDKMDVAFCLDVLYEAVSKYGIPAIFNQCITESMSAFSFCIKRSQTQMRFYNGKLSSSILDSRLLDYWLSHP